jgi:hypothetical protein
VASEQAWGAHYPSTLEREYVEMTSLAGLADMALIEIGDIVSRYCLKLVREISSLTLHLTSIISPFDLSGPAPLMHVFDQQNNLAVGVSASFRMVSWSFSCSIEVMLI